MRAVFVSKEKFGIERFYPNNSIAYELCDLIGMKTLEKRYIEKANNLGIEIQIYQGTDILLFPATPIE